MLIAVNVRWLLPNKLEGTGIYTLRMLEQIIPAHPQHQFLLIWDRPSAGPGMRNAHAFLNAQNVQHKTVLPPARHPWLWWYWNSIGVPAALKRAKADLYWSPDGLPARTKVPQWLTIHDLNFEHHPEWVPTHVGKYYRKHIRRGARIARQLFTVSEWSANDLIHTYGIAAGKIAITRNAPQRKFTPGPSSFSGPYFCAVGALTPRKNLITLIKAFDQWIVANPNRDDFKLRIAGTAHFNDPALNDALKGITHRNKVEWLGRCEDAQLEELYRGATAFCMPSAMEGFGIPVVEAMQCGTPVIASDNSALTEVVGGAGMLVPTYDVLAWAKALEHIADHANEWIEKSLKHGANFDWTQSAEPFIAALKNHEE